MAVTGRADLVNKGLNALTTAEKAAERVEFGAAATYIDIANAYARLAEALGDRSIRVTRAVGNW